MTKEAAKALLKKHGFKMQDYAIYLGIDPKSLGSRWRNGLDLQNQLMLHGFIAMHDTDYQTLQQCRDDATLRARLQQLQQ